MLSGVVFSYVVFLRWDDTLVILALGFYLGKLVDSIFCDILVHKHFTSALFCVYFKNTLTLTMGGLLWAGMLGLEGFTLLHEATID